MRETQNRNWKIIKEHFEIFDRSIDVIRDRDQFFFSRKQIGFNYDTLLTVIFAKQKSYRSALYLYRINRMISPRPMLSQYLPISLVSRQSLSKSTDDVALEQWRVTDKLTLAIPFDESLT